VDAARELPELPDDADHELAPWLLAEHDETRFEDVVELESTLRLHRPGEQVGETPCGEQREHDG
jgi:hypothetical protein